MDSRKKGLFPNLPVAAAIAVAALGYLVDVFDIALFSMVRVASLRDLGLSEDQVLSTGVDIFNAQLIGMLLGGLLWGVLGDKIGRIQVLFGSIFLYSAANLLNAFISSIDGYIICRFVAGIGLAGEVGAGITLVSELMSIKRRGMGTAIVAAAGTFGATVASVVSQATTWRGAYICGGIMGLALLVMRISVHESGTFALVKARREVPRGDIRLLFTNRERLLKYIGCIIAGTPLFFSYYVVIMLCPEIGSALQIPGGLVTAKAAFNFSIAMTVGDLLCGLLSQKLRSRRQSLAIFITLEMLSCVALLSLIESAHDFYLLCIPMGFFSGYWAVYITTAAEQFGTNVRATVATTAPNFVRATPIIMTYLFVAMKSSLGVIDSLFIVGALAFSLSLLFVLKMRETYGSDLSFIELKHGVERLTPIPEYGKAEGWQ